ncbi:MAG: histidine phosphatase family protein [Paraglaciecola sp.]|nr:histidine phosphatase family protein [Paraglaciecola sp.]
MQGRLQGQLESPLTSVGKEQARLLSIRAKEWDISTVLSSSLGRAQQTADICAQALNLKTEVQHGFEERCYGAWRGSLLSQLHCFEYFKQHCYLQPECIPCDGAESTATVRARMVSQLNILGQKHNKGNVLLISHGDAIDCLLSIWTTPKTLTNCQQLRLDEVADGFVWNKP